MIRKFLPKYLQNVELITWSLDKSLSIEVTIWFSSRTALVIARFFEKFMLSAQKPGFIHCYLADTREEKKINVAMNFIVQYAFELINFYCTIADGKFYI